MPATWTWHGDELLSRLPEAEDAGILAAAYVYRNHVVENYNAHHGGYLTGAFATGLTVNSIQVSEVGSDSAGNRMAAVYTDQITALYWALGHQNLFTRRYERVDHWTPAIADSAEEARAAFLTAASAVLGTA